MRIVIRLHPEAPPKPRTGDACNGCGVCCATAPCPIGIVVSRRLRGACAALVWAEEAARYRCGMVVQPQAHLPRGLRWAARWIGPLASRYISAGSGCDTDLEIEGGADRPVA